MFCFISSTQLTMSTNTGTDINTALNDKWPCVVIDPVTHKYVCNGVKTTAWWWFIKPDPLFYSPLFSCIIILLVSQSHVNNRVFCVDYVWTLQSNKDEVQSPWVNVCKMIGLCLIWIWYHYTEAKQVADIMFVAVYCIMKHDFKRLHQQSWASDWTVGLLNYADQDRTSHWWSMICHSVCRKPAWTMSIKLLPRKKEKAKDTPTYLVVLMTWRSLCLHKLGKPTPEPNTTNCNRVYIIRHYQCIDFFALHCRYKKDPGPASPPSQP